MNLSVIPNFIASFFEFVLAGPGFLMLKNLGAIVFLKINFIFGN